MRNTKKPKTKNDNRVQVRLTPEAQKVLAEWWEDAKRTFPTIKKVDLINTAILNSGGSALKYKAMLSGAKLAVTRELKESK